MTVEQAAYNKYPDQKINVGKWNDRVRAARLGFIAGAEWQAQQDGWISVRDDLPKESGRY